MNTDKQWLLFLKTASILKKELGVTLPSDAIVYHYDDLLFIDTLVFIQPNTVINICPITEKNHQRYSILYKLYQERQDLIDNENVVILNDQYYIEKYVVNNVNSVKLFSKKYSLNELEQLIKSVVELNQVAETYQYDNPYYREYIEFSYGKEIADKIVPTMLNRKLICSHGNSFCGAFVLGKFNNLQHIQQYPEEQFLMVIYISQYLYHQDNLNFTNDLINLFKKYNFNLDLLPVFVNDMKFTITDFLDDTSRLIWLTEDERNQIAALKEQMLLIDHHRNFNF